MSVWHDGKRDRDSDRDRDRDRDMRGNRDLKWSRRTLEQPEKAEGGLASLL